MSSLTKGSPSPNPKLLLLIVRHLFTKFKHQEIETFMEKHYKSRGAQTLVDPNPPTPLTVASKSSTSMTLGVTIFSRINTAILLPTFTSKSKLEWLNKITPNESGKIWHTQFARKWYGADPNPLSLGGLPDQR